MEALLQTLRTEKGLSQEERLALIRRNSDREIAEIRSNSDIKIAQIRNSHEIWLEKFRSKKDETKGLIFYAHHFL